MVADEWVDRLDADDVPCGRVRRAVMRRDNLRHRCVWILVFDPTGALFVHQRTANKDLYPSFWDVAVGGVVAAGEPYEEAARRELAEEVGVADVPLCALAAVQFADSHTNVVGKVYACTFAGVLELQASEVVRGEWIAACAMAETLATRPFCPDGLAALAAAVGQPGLEYGAMLERHLKALTAVLPGAGTARPSDR